MITLSLFACLLMYIQAKKLVVKHISAGLGIRVALLSDLHVDMSLVSREKIINKTSKVQPNIIVITGDLCSNMKYFYRVEYILKGLAEKNACPILVTLGNHDNRIFEKQGINKAEYIQKIEKIAKNIIVLENKTYEFKGFIFGGLGDIQYNDCDCAKLSEKWKNYAQSNNKRYILLTHNPDMVLRLNKKSSPEIMLSGHTHGGQMRVPFNIEFRVLKDDILPKKNIFYGKHKYNDITMYITSGIGCSALPFRFRSVAEISVVE